LCIVNYCKRDFLVQKRALHLQCRERHRRHAFNSFEILLEAKDTPILFQPASPLFLKDENLSLMSRLSVTLFSFSLPTTIPHLVTSKLGIGQKLLLREISTSGRYNLSPL